MGDGALTELDCADGDHGEDAELAVETESSLMTKGPVVDGRGERERLGEEDG